MPLPVLVLQRLLCFLHVMNQTLIFLEKSSLAARIAYWKRGLQGTKHGWCCSFLAITLCNMYLCHYGNLRQKKKLPVKDYMLWLCWTLKLMNSQRIMTNSSTSFSAADMILSQLPTFQYSHLFWTNVKAALVDFYRSNIHLYFKVNLYKFVQPVLISKPTLYFNVDRKVPIVDPLSEKCSFQ